MTDEWMAWGMNKEHIKSSNVKRFYLIKGGDPSSHGNKDMAWHKNLILGLLI